MTARIPAWKRLGLKLKYAREPPVDVPTAVSTKAHDADLPISERAAKRRRLVKDEPATPPGQNRSQSSSQAPAQHRPVRDAERSNDTSQTEDSSTADKTIRRKKSVTFTQETKKEDGDSRTTIDFPAGSPGSTPKTSRSGGPPEDTNHNGIAGGDHAPPSANGHSTPTKAKAKSKTSRKPQQSKSSMKDKSSLALEYLDQHRCSRKTWKFNKLLDVWTLTHALDPQAIPSTHILALAGYIQGLPTQAGSRTRLIRECRDAFTPSETGKATPTPTIDEDRTAFLRHLEPDSGEEDLDVEALVRTYSRPAVLLWALGETLGDSSTNSSAPQSIPSPAANKKKKKSRTSAPIDLSSSSDSSSSESESENDSETTSSDDSSSNDERPRKEGARGLGKSPSGQGEMPDETPSSEDDGDEEESTSSSGSSSSDSSGDD